MARVDHIKPVYVQYIPPPDSVKEGELYITLNSKLLYTNASAAAVRKL